jgi:SNF2 family DNA or RNA helicase
MADITKSNYPKSKTKPWDHQVDAIVHTRNRKQRGAYLAMDMGTGKTKAAIDYATDIDARFILIICPKSVIDVWPDEFQQHSAIADQYEILAPTTGTIEKKCNELRTKYQVVAMRNGRLVFITNYDAFWRPPLGIKRMKKVIVNKGFLVEKWWDLIICDEAHRLMSPGGKASWGAQKLCNKIPHRLFLSGTPMPSSPFNLYAQMRALDPTIFGTSFVNFRARYAVMGGYENRQVLRWQNLDELHSKFYQVAFRVKKTDVLTLPPTMHEKRFFDIKPRTRRIYNELEKEFVAQVGNEEISVDNVLTKMLRLHQLTGGNLQIDGKETTDFIDDSKLAMLKELLVDLPPDEPIVIFCNFKPEIDQILELMASKDVNRNCAELSGRGNQLKQWQNAEFNSIVVQIQAGGVGVSLVRSCYCIYYSTNCSLGDYQQSLARTDRPGQTRPVTYYHLIGRNTIDQQIYHSLSQKERVVEAVVRDKQRKNQNKKAA